MVLKQYFEYDGISRALLTGAIVEIGDKTIGELRWKFRSGYRKKKLTFR